MTDERKYRGKTQDQWRKTFSPTACYGDKLLEEAFDHIRELQAENASLTEKLQKYETAIQSMLDDPACRKAIAKLMAGLIATSIVEQELSK